MPPRAPENMQLTAAAAQEKSSWRARGQSLQQAVDEAGVEDVAGAGGVDDGDAVGWAMEELVAVPGEDAVLAEGCGGEPAAEAALHAMECGLEVLVGHEAAGEVARDDEVVDVVDQLFDAGVELVEVGDDGDAGLAGPAAARVAAAVSRPSRCRARAEVIQLRRQFFGLQDHGLVALAEDGALAFVDHDEILQAVARRGR